MFEIDDRQSVRQTYQQSAYLPVGWVSQSVTNPTLLATVRYQPNETRILSTYSIDLSIDLSICFSFSPFGG